MKKEGEEDIHNLVLRRFKSNNRKDYHKDFRDYGDYETYQPKRKHFKVSFPTGDFTNFLRKYIYFRVPSYIKHYLMSFLLMIFYHLGT